MKMKSILLALAVSSLTVFGQGQISFQNGAAPLQQFYINAGPDAGNSGVRTLMGTGANAYTFYVTYGAIGTENSSIASPIFNSTSTAGRLAGNVYYTLSAAPAGTAVNLQMLAFSTPAGSYAAALTTAGANHGASPIISVTPNTGSPLPSGTVIFGNANSATAMAAFDLYTTIPEPSTIALLGLGAVSLFAFRRRK